jgi:hypothetical protein
MACGFPFHGHVDAGDTHDPHGFMHAVLHPHSRNLANPRDKGHEMSVTDLLQDGSIILLAGSQIIQSFTIRNLRTRLLVLKAKAKTSDHNPDSLIQQYEDKIAHDDYRRLTFHIPLYKVDTSFNFRLFSAGDSVKIYDFDGELILRGYSEDGFIAETRTNYVPRLGTKVTFHPSRVRAWKRNNGEWPVDWFTTDSERQARSAK